MKKWIALVVLVACGGRTGEDAVDAGGDAGSTGADGGAIDASDACNAATNALAKIATDKYCTSLLRLSSSDLAILGGSVVCGPLKTADDTAARAAFDAQIPPYTMASEYTRVGPIGGTYDFVYFHSPGDFGGIGIVSLATSKLVFSGALAWSAPGKIIYPTSFLSPAQIPAVCAPQTLPDVQGVSIGMPPTDGELGKIADVASRSALVRAIEGSHAIVHTLVVPFPLDGAPGNGPPKNEWLVVFDSARLE